MKFFKKKPPKKPCKYWRTLHKCHICKYISFFSGCNKTVFFTKYPTIRTIFCEKKGAIPIEIAAECKLFEEK